MELREPVAKGKVEGARIKGINEGARLEDLEE